MGDVDNGGGYVYMGEEEVWEISVLSQIFCDLNLL